MFWASEGVGGLAAPAALFSSPSGQPQGSRLRVVGAWRTSALPAGQALREPGMAPALLNSGRCFGPTLVDLSQRRESVRMVDEGRQTILA